MRVRYTLVPPAFLIAVAILRPMPAPVEIPVRNTPKQSILPLEIERPSRLRALVWLLPQPSTPIPRPESRRMVEGDAPAGKGNGMREQVIRRIAHLLELAYMAFDQRKLQRAINLCEQILRIDPGYAVALELKEDCEKSRHNEGVDGLVALKVEAWKKLTDDDEDAVIPGAPSVLIPTADEWAEMSRHFTDSVFKRADPDDDPDKPAIEGKLDTMMIDVAFENTKIEDILAFIRDFSGLNLLLDAEVRDRVDPDQKMSFVMKGMVLKHALRLFTSVLNLDYVVTEERVVLLTAPYRVATLRQYP